MKKLNREVISKYASRFSLVVMSFMLILSLCSMASPSGEFELTIQNPDNLPQDYSIEYYTLDGGMDEVGKPLAFGTNIAFGFLTNGNIEGEQLVPYGNYAMIYVVGDNLNGGTALTCNGTAYNLKTDYPLSCYVTDNPVITVTDDYAEDVSGLFIFVPIETPTSSITSVWTSITNWVISSLNTVQGVFKNPGIYYYVNEYPEISLTYDGNSYGFDYDEFFSYRYMWYDGHRIDSLSELTQSVITVDGIQFDAYSYDGTVLAFSDGIEYMAIDNGLLGASNTPNPNSLTLLGTLAVIGLSISLAFLLIGIIRRFLRLRG